ncbi:MAG TPA: GDSL-type esterase/lipase family protein [candidate division Zixibacteria bacterium]|nr:GDSL-type esterase/lipase family protein [candidate division Zixibacteria bacterium]
MSNFWKLVLLGSIIINIIAVWGYFSYVKYGGNPLGEIKRKLTGQTHVSAPGVPYAEENAALKEAIADGSAVADRVVFLGASITQRWDLKKYLPEFPIINRGVGGQLVPQILTRFNRDVLELQPKAVIIKFCSINIRPELSLKTLEDGMTMMSELAEARGITPIISTIIPAGKPEAHIGDFSVVDSLGKFNDWARQYAKEKGYPLLDFAAAIADEDGFLPRDCSVDAVHLNDKGYEILSEAARPVLRRVLGYEE